MSNPNPRKKGLIVKLALVGGGIAAGAVAATAISAGAVTGSGSTATPAAAVSASASAAPPAPGSNGRPDGDRHGSRPVRSDEKAVAAATAAKLKATALKAVPGGTVYRVETDSGDATYEAHMTKSDGTEVTVKFDKNLKVTAVESGMGK